jgi:hypothetical protein
MRASPKLKTCYFLYFTHYYLLTVYMYIFCINSCIKVVQAVCPFNLSLQFISPRSSIKQVLQRCVPMNRKICILKRTLSIHLNYLYKGYKLQTDVIIDIPVFSLHVCSIKMYHNMHFKLSNKNYLQLSINMIL